MPYGLNGFGVSASLNFFPISSPYIAPPVEKNMNFSSSELIELVKRFRDPFKLTSLSN